MYRSLARCTRNSPCSRRVIWGTRSRPTRPIRADQRTPERAPPSAQRFPSIRCARPTRPRPVRIRRKWPPEAPRLEGQRRGRWIMRLARTAPLLLALSLVASVATADAECAWECGSIPKPMSTWLTRATAACWLRRSCSRSGPHARGLAEASRRDQKVATLSALQRFTFFPRRAADVGSGGKVERRDQPVTTSSTDRQLHARGRSREVRAGVFVPGLLAYVAIGRVQHSACARSAARLPDVAPARPRRSQMSGPRGGATREGRQHERQQGQGSQGHSITWSASSKIDFGIVTPRTLAVLRLQISSNVVG